MSTEPTETGADATVTEMPKKKRGQGKRNSAPRVTSSRTTSSSSTVTPIKKKDKPASGKKDAPAPKDKPKSATKAPIVRTRILPEEEALARAAKAAATRAISEVSKESQKCKTCGEKKHIAKFPTKHTKTGIGRGDECRACRDARAEAKKKAS